MTKVIKGGSFHACKVFGMVIYTVKPQKTIQTVKSRYGTQFQLDFFKKHGMK